MRTTVTGAVSNPFSTRAVRPGSIQFRFPASDSPDVLLSRLARRAWWGEIIGPHGSGKTTLLEALVPRLQHVGRHLVRFELHSGQSSLRPQRRAATRFARHQPGELIDAQPPWRHWNKETLVVVDGYEQLSWTSRWWLKTRCRWQQSGLLVTAHQPTGLPRLLKTQVTRELAHELVRSLLPPECQIIDTKDIDRCFDRHNGNLRETLFALYDVYEESRAESRESRARGS